MDTEFCVIEKGCLKEIKKYLDMIKEGKLPQITAVEDQSEDGVMKYVIKLRKGSDPNYVRDMIYKHTQMEGTYTVNFEVLNGIEPLRMSYKSYLQFFIEQRMVIKFRMYANRLQEVNTRYHKIKSYVEVLESNVLDQILNVINHLLNTGKDGYTAFVRNGTEEQIKINDSFTIVGTEETIGHGQFVKIRQ